VEAAVFDHERLEVYKLQLEFIGWATKLLEEIEQHGKRRAGRVLGHLDEASVSVLLNIAEGNGKRQRKVRAKFFDDARGSATECAGCLDTLVAKSVCLPDRVQPGKAMLERVVSMLTKLIARFDSDDDGTTEQ
jgi:four helix bundle protein